MATRSGVQAVLKAKDIKPDIVLADLSLSDKNGYEVAREIKNDPSLKNTFVLLLSSSTLTFDRLKAREVYADDFISKPLRSEELMTKLGPLTLQNNSEPELAMKPYMQSLESPAEGEGIFLNLISVLFVIFMFIAPMIYHLNDASLFDIGPSKIQSMPISVTEKGKEMRSKGEGRSTEGIEPSFLEYEAYFTGLISSMDVRKKGKEVVQANTKVPSSSTFAAAAKVEGVEKDTKPVLPSRQRLFGMEEISRGGIKNPRAIKKKTLVAALAADKGKEGQVTEELKLTTRVGVTPRKRIEEESRHKDRVLKDVEELILNRKALALKTEEGKPRKTTLKDVYELAEELRKRIGE